MVEHTLENYEGVRKIEFTSFEQPFTAARTWRAEAIINDNIYASYHINRIGENSEIGLNYNVADNEISEIKKKKEKSKDKKVEDIEVIYKKG